MKEYDDQFKAVLLADIPYFHALYAKYNDPLALETARNLGVYLAKLKKRTYPQQGIAKSTGARYDSK